MLPIGVSIYDPVSGYEEEMVEGECVMDDFTKRGEGLSAAGIPL